MKNLKAILHNRAFYGLLVLTLLTVGVGGYVLLANQPAANDNMNPIPAPAPVNEAAAPARQIPAESKPAEAVVPPVEETPEPEVEIPVSNQTFIPDDTPVVVSAPSVVVSPLDGEVLAAFSMDRLMYNETLEDWRTHDGVDIAAAVGDAVLSASSGTVFSVDNDPLMGTTVVIDHADGCRTTYANLQANPAVAEDDKVSAGQIIGAVGETAVAEAAQGPHLHFSVSKNGTPMDPNEYLN